jgi:hypothetical protein
MKVAGFTFIRNAVKYDFPFLEAVTSILPVCDVIYIALGDSSDDTAGLVRSLPVEKTRIIETVWDPGISRGGEVYARETNKAFDAIPAGYDWCFYIQGDEVLHEKYLEEVKRAMLRWKDIREVEGLLFNYLHFYGTYDYTGDSRHWYRREVRIIRNDKSIRSYRDAQGFRKNGQKLQAVPVNATIHHYGWVRHPRYMQEKVDAVQKFYAGITGEEAQKKVMEGEFDYGAHIDALARFRGTHPKVMHDRIQRLNWKADLREGKRKMTLRYRLLWWFEKVTSIRLFEFRNYKIMAAKRHP